MTRQLNSCLKRQTKPRALGNIASWECRAIPAGHHARDHAGSRAGKAASIGLRHHNGTTCAHACTRAMQGTTAQVTEKAKSCKQS